jgi:hypothetical protein
LDASKYLSSEEGETLITQVSDFPPHLSFASSTSLEKEWRDRPDSNRGLPTPQAGALSRLDYGPVRRDPLFDL